MTVSRKVTRLTEEIAALLASRPSREKLLSYHPSARTQDRASGLLQKLKSGRITAEEQWELDQFQHAEMLMQLVKAKLRASKVS